MHCDLKRLIDYDLPDVVQRVIGSNPFRDSKIFSLSHRHACDMVIITVFTFIHWGQHQNKQFLPSEPVFGQLAGKSLNMKWQHWGHIFLLIGCNWDTLISLFLHMPISQHLDLTEIYYFWSFFFALFFLLPFLLYPVALPTLLSFFPMELWLAISSEKGKKFIRNE